MLNSRQLAFLTLRDIHRHAAFTDVALNQWFQKTGTASQPLSFAERRLATELVYGSVRRQRTLDALIDQLAKKKASQQPPDLRIILHLGFYQLRYLTHIPPSAAVNTTVDLAKENGLAGLAGLVNGILRQYLRGCETGTDPLKLPKEPVQQLGILHSFPDWIINFWLESLGWEETQQLCEWFNQSPHLDLRINPLKTSLEAVETAMQTAGIEVTRLPYLLQALRLANGAGAIEKLPGYDAGWWTIQDSSAQLVSALLDPQPGETIIDACAAPGGKTTHIAELMQDHGTIWACDKTASRLKKVKENAERHQLKSIQIAAGDSRNFPQFAGIADRVLLDAPCSGLGTLHRRADLRWRQVPGNLQELSKLQSELLEHSATWVKPGGVLVYSTCTLHPLENETVIEEFLKNHQQWKIEMPVVDSTMAFLTSPQGWIKIWPHHHNMDGFFMVKLRLGNG
jgi:16S rRNA (cytosine967-C5)-methyltransferase